MADFKTQWLATFIVPMFASGLTNTLRTPNLGASPAAVFPQAPVTERPVALPPGKGEAPDGKISVIFHFFLYAEKNRTSDLR